MHDAAADAAVLRLARAEGEARWWLDGLATLKVTGESNGGKYSLVELFRPAGSAVPRHVRHREDELVYVLEGTLTMRVGDEPVDAGPGSCVLLPRGVPRDLRVGGEGPARYLVLYSPAGFERFIRESGRPARAAPDSAEPREGPGEAARLATLMRDVYGCEWLDGSEAG